MCQIPRMFSVSDLLEMCLVTALLGKQTCQGCRPDHLCQVQVDIKIESCQVQAKTRCG